MRIESHNICKALATWPTRIKNQLSLSFQAGNIDHHHLNGSSLCLVIYLTDIK